MRLIRRRKLSGMHGFSLSILTEWGGLMLGCGFYVRTNSLTVRTFTEVRLVDAGTALRPPGKYGNFFFMIFISKSSNSVKSIFSFRDTVQPEI